jgi:hypothetical protein
MRREGHYVRSKTDYILAQELSDFRRWAIKIPRVNTDHRAIIAEMKLGRLYIHRQYTTCQRRLPDFPIQWPLSENDVRFQHLKEFNNEIPDLPTARERLWILKRTWDLIDKQIKAVRWHRAETIIRDYSKEIRKSLRKDR